MVEVTPSGRTEFDDVQEKRSNKSISIFLAGTIDNGSSNNWQKELVEELVMRGNLPSLTIYNPRRDDWPSDASANEVKRQIYWEAAKLDECDYIFMFLEDSSKSPISLLELGLYAESKKLHVFFTDNFYRCHNVEITCKKHYIPYVKTNDIKEVAEYIYNIIKK